ncbi:hypothetical protein JD844_033963 [Phrynosoma platyrhinos]|uniref:Uncharacterized protein n=1 Tax=Phrynosoma platyrhinos TaxID=52577 RepID=A0ABQ7T7X6_PHRPL|nr:hypothetical protein JD844_033963 [Phrynosoma platyrhinos]
MFFPGHLFRHSWGSRFRKAGSSPTSQEDAKYFLCSAFRTGCAARIRLLHIFLCAFRSFLTSADPINNLWQHIPLSTTS